VKKNAIKGIQLIQIDARLFI